MWLYVRVTHHKPAKAISSFALHFCLKRWQYYTSGSCHDVTFQVWRPVDVTISEYQLVGENILSEMAPAEIVTPPPICVLRGTQSTGRRTHPFTIISISAKM